jgi:hemerythrin-like domain-containing protein
MNPFTLLKKDHKTVAGLLNKLEKTTARRLKSRNDLFEQLKEALDVHTSIEEKILYPALKEKQETEDIALEAIEEHKIVKTLLAELDESAKDTDEWTAKLTVLKENIEHHVEEEEGEMFPKSQKLFSKAELEDLGNRLAEEKQKLTPEEVIAE